MTSSTAPLSRRQRLRQQTLADIKQAAVQQITEGGGAGSLSLNALAKSLGMAGPSLYRYFDSRDALLTELLVDGYNDLAGTLAAVTSPGGQASRSAADLLRAYGHAYRAWALGHRGLYDLMFGTPVPGYAAPEEATGAAAARGLFPLISVITAIRPEPGQPRDPPPGQAAPGQAAPGQAAPGQAGPSGRWQAVLRRTGADEHAFVTAVRIWARIHGLTTLEIQGHLGQMVSDPGAVFDQEIEQVIAELTS